MTIREMAESLDAARRAVLEVARDHLRRARHSFEGGDYPAACFTAMTSMEEAGKTSILHMARLALALVVARGIDPEAEASTTRDAGTRQLRDLLRDHSEKARQAATAALYVNAGADRRHGRHPTSGIHRTDGVVLLARSREWMSIRNSCLYVDYDLDTGVVRTPGAAVEPALAHYMITMAYEVVADSAYHGVASGDPARPDYAEASELEAEVLREMDVFVRSTAEHAAAVDALWFLADPAPLRKVADTHELKAEARRERQMRRQKPHA